MRFSVDPWDPAYGSPLEGDELAASTAPVDPAVEVEPARWAPLAPMPATSPAGVVLFVDGVRRIEARVWVEADDGSVAAGICASYAAGVVRCDGTARVVAADVGRGLFATTPAVDDVVTTAGTFGARPVVAAAGVDVLSLALQDRMGAAEVAVAHRVCEQEGGDLIVVDGPLRGRQQLRGAVGLVKTHRVSYLPADLERVITALGPGQRTPLFLVATQFSRYSWYARLPGPGGAPWAGVVRCECSPDMPVAEAAALAHTVTATLPRFASEPHKEPRAPQNLYPIAGLERELRRRLGDPALVYRALRSAART